MKIDKFNSEGYKDMTSYAALSNVTIPSYMPIVYICSPYAGHIKNNVLNARKYSRFAIKMKCIPLTPHLLYPQFMDDNNPKEHALTRRINAILLGKCQELWVFGSVISSGMEYEITMAKKRNMRIKFYNADFQEVAEL